MRVWHILRSRIRTLAFRGSREDDLREELQLHLERETDRLQATGMSREEARAQAMRLFGSIEPIKEACRDARGTAPFDALARDARYGLRRLRHDWGFAAAAVLILGIAIGANTAIFSFVNAVLFRPQAVADPDRVVNIYQNDRAGKPLVVTSYGAYLDIAAYTDIFAGTMAASVPDSMRYLHEGAVRDATFEYATAGYLDVLGLHPSLGRWFDAAEARPAAAPVAVLGHQAWTHVFHADPAIVGRVVRIEGIPVTIVGVGPVNHRGTVDIGVGTDFWLPITAQAALNRSTAVSDIRAIRGAFLVKARLRDGVSVAQARAAMDVLSSRLVAEHPDEYQRAGELAIGPGITVLGSTAVRVHPQADTVVIALGSLVLVIVGLVLAIASSNMATLLLVRGAARSREIAVRLAIGATRTQLVRQLLMESLLLSLGGGAVGCVLASWGIHVLQGLDLPLHVDVTLDARVLAFAIALSLATGVAFGLAPALKATRVNLLSTLRDEGLAPIDRRRLTLKNALVVAQVAISVLLLGGTSIFVQMTAAAKGHRVGFAVDGVAMLQTDLRFAGYSPVQAKTAVEELVRRIEAIPGVESTALLQGLPMSANGAPIVVDTSAASASAAVQAVEIGAGPGFFETLRIPVLYGRSFDGRDRAETPRVAVVTERMARQHFGTANAVGRRFHPANEPASWIEVVGVVADTGTGNFAHDVLDPIAPVFYVSHTQSAALPTTVIARTSSDAGALAAAMQRELRAQDVTLPVVTAMTMAQSLEQSQAAPKAAAMLLGVLGGVGLLLASIGLYAVVAFAVARRTREIGVRIALGAGRQQVVWSIARGVAGLLAVGTGIGLFLSVLAMLVLRSASGDIGIGNIAVYHPRIDPIALLTIAAATGLVGVAAAIVPSRRAARMNPLTALRHE